MNTATSTQTVVEEVRLIYVDVEENSNKTYFMRVFDDGSLFKEWGRVGKTMRSNTKNYGSVSAALSEMRKKTREQKREGYEIIETIEEGSQIAVSPIADLKSIAKSEIKHDGMTAELIDYLISVNAHQITSNSNVTYNARTGQFSTALGIVLPAAISRARTLLNQISNDSFPVATYDQKNGRLQALNDYLRLVPQDLGMKLNASIFSTDEEIKQQNELLEALEAAVTPVPTTTQLGDKTFDCSLELVDSPTLDKLTRLYEKSLHRSHTSSKFRVKRAYKVHIPSMQEAFDKEAQKLGNVRELWHGTKASNLLSILKSGLIIVPSTANQVSGRMFGDGIYASTESTKALNYATNYWNSSSSCDRYFMFLVDFACGKMFQPITRDRSFPVKGYDSTWVERGNCNLYNHEAIVYRVSQVNLKYLVEFG